MAVIIGTAIYFGLGALWYSTPVLGRQWQRAIGWDESKPPPARNPVSYALPAAAYLVAAVATGMLAAATGTDTLGEGIVLGLVVGIGYAVTLTAVDAAFDPNRPQPWTWFGISAAYHPSVSSSWPCSSP